MKATRYKNWKKKKYTYTNRTILTLDIQMQFLFFFPPLCVLLFIACLLNQDTHFFFCSMDCVYVSSTLSTARMFRRHVFVVVVVCMLHFLLNKKYMCEYCRSINLFFISVIYFSIRFCTSIPTYVSLAFLSAVWSNRSLTFSVIHLSFSHVRFS